MCLFSAPQIGKPAIAPPNPATGTLRGTIGICGAIGWGHRCSNHGDRGAEPLEGRALADLFGVRGCVLLIFVLTIKILYEYNVQIIRSVLVRTRISL